MRQREGAAPLDIIDRRFGQAEAKAYLDAVAAELRDRGLEVDVEVTEGPPADRILAVARSRGADLILLTSHGLGGCTEFPVSGTAHKVISRAGASVMIVPTGAGAAASRPGPQRRIMVFSDCSLRGDWAIVPAAELARAAGAELVLVHVVQVPEPVGKDPMPPEYHELVKRLVRVNREAAERHLHDAVTRLDGGELRVRTHIEVSPHVAKTLSEVAAREDVDLIVLTAHGAAGSVQAPYGGIVAQLLGDVRRPLLVAQDAPRTAPYGTAGAALREGLIAHGR
jgi:nucleotide-binding universal stress UspA family protein